MTRLGGGLSGRSRGVSGPVSSSSPLGVVGSPIDVWLSQGKKEENASGGPAKAKVGENGQGKGEVM
jgi:hypothetical protein